MNVKRSVAITASCFLFVFYNCSFAQLRFWGNTHVEYSHNNSDDVKQRTANRRDFFENWTESFLQYKNWRLGFRIGMHNPPVVFAPDQTRRPANIEQRFLEYDSGTMSFRVGHFYTLFGRGLTLRFFENRQLRYDTRIDGIRFTYLHPKFDLKWVSGQPINRENNRQKLFHAAELKLKFSRFLHFGGSFLTTHPQSKKRIHWGSVFSEINFDYGSLYGEYAAEHNPGAARDGEALYLNGNIFIGAFSLVMEYKDYDKFEQFEGALFNNPPLVAREHLFTLLNRQQLIQNADDEKGILIEASYPVIQDGVLTAHYSHTENQSGEKKYQEVYGQFDWTTPFDWEWLLAFSRQEDPSARYLNFVNSTSLEVSDYNSLRVVYEHQHTRKLLNDQQFYSQAISLGFSHAPLWTLSFLGERTTEQGAKKSIWAGVQLDLNVSERFELSIFAGSRRKGKICVGGVCVIKPELTGLEARLITRF